MSTGKLIAMIVGGVAVLVLLLALISPGGISLRNLTGSVIDSQNNGSNDVGSVEKGCVIGGCSSELCGEEGDDLVSNCIYNPAFACYQLTRCERQSNGRCGWTETNELASCIENAKANLPDK